MRVILSETCVIYLFIIFFVENPINLTTFLSLICNILCNPKNRVILGMLQNKRLSDPEKYDKIMTVTLMKKIQRQRKETETRSKKKWN